MTDVTPRPREPRPGGRVLDVASGFGQDAIALAARGAHVVGAEPSARMTALGAAPERRRAARRRAGCAAGRDALPFADGELRRGALQGRPRPLRPAGARDRRDGARDAAATAAWCSRSPTSSRSPAALARALDDAARRLARAPRGPRPPALRRAGRPLHALRPRPDARAGGARARARCASTASRSAGASRPGRAPSSGCRRPRAGLALRALDCAGARARPRSPTSWCSCGRPRRAARQQLGVDLRRCARRRAATE